jgi:hypothetical protein
LICGVVDASTHEAETNRLPFQAPVLQYQLTDLREVTRP